VAKKHFSLQDTFAFSILGLLPFIVYDFYFFGTIVPHAVLAKSVVYSIPSKVVIADIAASLVPTFFLSGSSFKSAGQQAYFAILAATVSVLVIYGMVKGPTEHRTAEEKEIGALFLIWGLGVLSVYTLSSVLLFPWYVPLYAVPLLLVLSKVMLDSRTRLATFALTILALPLVISQLAGLSQTILGATVNPAYYQGFERGARVRHYLELGARLYDQYPDATLMTSELGGLGYSFRGYVMDGAGLVSPGALTYHPMSIPEERSHGKFGAIPVGFIEDTNPEIIVSYDAFVEAFLKSSVRSRYVHTVFPAFLPDDLMRSEQKTLWTSRNLNLFIRRDLVNEADPP
jgi:hypothetical protein